MLNEHTTLTHSDIANLVLQAHKAGMRGEFIYQVSIFHPNTASQSPDCSIGMLTAPLQSGSSGEPIPTIIVR